MNCRVILASKSPRRRQLLSYFGIRFSVVVPTDCLELEEASSYHEVRKLVLYNAYQKASSVFNSNKSAIVIGADTVVFCKNKVFGKPKNKKQAKDYLYFLSRNPHWVYTAVVMLKEGVLLEEVEKTKVYMIPLSKKEIDLYLQKEAVLDKAGGFGIQGFAGTFIQRIEGCFYNVMGLPLAKVRLMFKKLQLL